MPGNEGERVNSAYLAALDLALHAESAMGSVSSEKITERAFLPLSVESRADVTIVPPLIRQETGNSIVSGFPGAILSVASDGIDPLTEDGEADNSVLNHAPPQGSEAGILPIKVWRMPSAHERRELIRKNGPGRRVALFGEFGSGHNIRMDQEEQNVSLPEKYKQYAGAKEINVHDLAFFEELLGRYGLSGNGSKVEQEERLFGEREFMTACEEVKTYVMDLRDRVLPKGIPNEGSPESVANDELMGNRRIQELILLFLHHPKIRTEFINIHAQKMGFAFPEFRERLAGISDVDVSGRDAYMQEASDLMSWSMFHASFQFPRGQVDTLGMLMGYQLEGVLPVAADRRRVFSSVGVGSFTNVLGDVVGKAISEREDVHDAVRREFLTREGLAFILARTHIESFKQNAGKAIYNKTLHHNWESVKTADYEPGICPAIVKIPRHDGTMRPIMYEYAESILSAMPERFLKEGEAESTVKQ